MITDVLPEYWQSLITVYIAVFIAFVSPGPNFIAISSRAVESRGTGIGVALGISIGTAIWAISATTGVATILSSYEGVTSIIGGIGGGYLCWLGYKSFRSSVAGAEFKFEGVGGGENISFLAASKVGLLIQLSNPKTVLFWLAITPLVIGPETPHIVIMLLVIGCFFIALFWHFLLAFLFSAGPVRSAYISYKPKISFIFAVFFVGFGVRLIYETLS
ncbi:hypothetical protein A9Q83_12620 [Alphaproteobacteria bacterium 46_93_T64]|nr:hypothetical protein A9Q83_12620 [Alphaproteobacteria bacterium 46_93_T64]